MPSAQTHPTELHRLATLRALDILDTPPDPSFDRLTRLACRLFGTPIAAISLIDEHRQWFKSIQGLSITQTPRCDAFCAHTILSPDLLLVNDALTDPRVRDNPLVTGELGIRFYAGVPLYAPNGEPLGAFSVLDTVPRSWDPANTQSLFELAALASEAIDARLHARRASAALHTKRLFAANMSHEIRTPLNVIQGHAELLAQRLANGSDVRESVDAITRNTHHLADVAEAIIEFASLDADTLELHFQDFNPANMLNSIRPLFENAAAHRGLSLNIRWCGESNLCVHSDLARIRRVLHNLVSNAIEFTPSGSVTLIGFVDSSVQDSVRINFTVSDTGPGLTQSQFAQAIQPFAQLDPSSTRQHGGIGLGLSIAASLVHCLGGSITLQCKPGQGCTFDVAFPCALAHAAAASKKNTTLRPSTTGSGLQDRSILFADDCLDNQRLISLILRKAGAAVQVVSDGAAAVAVMQSREVPFDVVLMDMQMPVMNGCDATRRLRELGFTLPIIAFTANASTDDRDACFAAGCDDFITKPITHTALIARLAALTRPRTLPVAA